MLGGQEKTRGSLLQDNGIDKTRPGGRLPLPPQGTQAETVTVRWHWGVHTLAAHLCMRQRRPATGSRSFWPQRSSNLLLLLFCLTSWCCDPRGLLFSLPHFFPLSLIKTIAEAALLPSACLVHSKGPFCSLNPNPSPSHVARGSILFLCDSEIENVLSWSFSADYSWNDSLAPPSQILGLEMNLILSPTTALEISVSYRFARFSTSCKAMLSIWLLIPALLSESSQCSPASHEGHQESCGQKKLVWSGYFMQMLSLRAPGFSKAIRTLRVTDFIIHISWCLLPACRKMFHILVFIYKWAWWALILHLYVPQHSMKR